MLKKAKKCQIKINTYKQPHACLMGGGQISTWRKDYGKLIANH